MSDSKTFGEGMTELHLACYHGELEWVQNCINGGLDVNAHDNGGFTPLHWVADMGVVDGDREEIVRLLIKSGADVNAFNDSGESVFFRAVMGGNYEIVHILIDSKANVHTPDNKGVTPLALAVGDEHDKMVEIIRQASNLSAS